MLELVNNLYVGISKEPNSLYFSTVLLGMGGYAVETIYKTVKDLFNHLVYFRENYPMYPPFSTNTIFSLHAHFFWPQVKNNPLAKKWAYK